ncbi:MAG: hypothetical protein AB7G06_01835 [Bdellovibrionales bacterium]
MGLWFGIVVFTGVFTSLYFLYGTDQLAMFQDTKVAAAEIMRRCHNSAVNESRINSSLGATSENTLMCTHGAGNLTNSSATGLTVTGPTLSFNPGTTVGLSASERVVVTYVISTGTLNAISFSELRSQVGTRYFNDPSIGIVQSGGGISYIESVSGTQVRVPATIPVGALAMVTTL